MRAMLKAIDRIGEQTCVTDDEMIMGLNNVVLNLEDCLKRQREARMKSM
jgi:hypothetical protein